MADHPTISREEVAALIRRIGVKGADEAFVTRAAELSAGTVAQMARLPHAFGKEIEPAHVFVPPLGINSNL